MSVIPYPTLRLKLIMPQAFRLQLHDQNKLEMRFLPALPGFNATQAANKVSGPGDGVSTDNAIARWDGTNGRVIQNSLNIIDDLGNTSIAGSFSVTGPSKLAGYVADTTINYFVPTNGGSAVLANDAWYVVLTPAATIATYTLTLPALPNDGQIINIKSARTITSFDLNANSGQTIDNDAGLFPVGLPAGGTITATYRTSTTSWSVAVPGSATVVDGDKGDITVAGGVWTIDPGVVSYAKIQNVATSRVLGRISAGPGVVQELTGADLKTFIGSGDLAKLDDTNVTMTMTGTPTGALFNSVSLQLGWIGTLGVAQGGIGVGTITGLMQGNGISAVTGIANSSTVGQVLRVTGASTYAWGAIDLSLAGATTGDLPFSALAQGLPRSVLGVAGNVTADVASIQGTADQVLRVNSAGNALAFGQLATGGIADNSISFAKLADIASPRFVGRITGGSGDPEELTGTQATTLLDQFSTSTLLKGVVPGSNGVGITNFLRADGSWAAPPGGSGTGLIVLTADTTYYVDVTLGSDVTGDGTIGLPWQTLQHALFWVQQHVNVGSPYSLTIKLADGTYSEGPFLYAPVFVGTLSALSLGAVFILGNDLDPSAVVIDTAGGFFYSTARLLMQYVTFESTTVQAEGGQAALFIGNCRTTGAAPMGFAQFWANNGALVELKDIEVDGTADAFMYADINSTINYKQGALTLTSDPLWPAGCFNLKRFSNGQFNPDGGVTGTSSGVKINLVEHARLNIISPAVLADVPGASIGTYDPDCEVSVDGTVVLGGDGMKVLTANTTYYVDITLGSDVTGDGSIGAPWQHLHYALAWTLQHIVLGGPWTLTCQLADGTYGADPDFVFGGFAPGLCIPTFLGTSAGDTGGIAINGNAADDSAVVIDTGGGILFVTGVAIATNLTFDNTTIWVSGATAQFYANIIRLGDTPAGGTVLAHAMAFEGAIVQLNAVEIFGTAASYLYAEEAIIHHDHDYLKLTVDPLWPNGTVNLRKFARGYINTEDASLITGTSSGPKYLIEGFCSLLIVGMLIADVPGTGGTASGDSQVVDGTNAQVDPTPAEETAFLVPFVGDTGSGGIKGLVPAPATGDATKFLRGDATFVDLSGVYQPLDSDLTAIAALTTTTAGRSGLTLADPNLDRLQFWDDSAGTMKLGAIADFTVHGSPAAGDKLLLMRAGTNDLAIADWSTLPSGGGGGGTPGGSTTQIQYNNSGAFGGMANFTNSSGNPNVSLAGSYLYDGSDIAYGLDGAGFGVPYWSYFFGPAGNHTLTGYRNNGFGHWSLINLTTGHDNVGIGNEALRRVDSGSNNTAVGITSGAFLTSGTQNTLFGNGTGGLLTVGTNNAVMGVGALGNEVNGNNNMAIGAFALALQNGASQNVAIGASAGEDLTTGSNDICLGYRAGKGITTGSQNVIIGDQLTGLPAALSSNIILGTGGGTIRARYNDNTSAYDGWQFFGTQGVKAQLFNVPAGGIYKYNGGNLAYAVDNGGGGLINYFFGATGNFTLSGDGNVAVGINGLSALSSGIRNLAMGGNALTDVTTGNYNVAIGAFAAKDLTTGSANLAIGAGAGQHWVSGGGNVAIGNNALFNETSQPDNVAIGQDALASQNGGIGNVAIGKQAGLNVTIGYENVIIGRNTGFGVTTGIRNVIIGANITGLSASMSYAILFADGAGRIRAFYDPTRGGADGGWDLTGDWGVRVNGTSFLLRSSVTLPAGGTGNVPTLTAGPVTGNPTKWIPIDDNGTTRYIPAW